MFTFKTRTEKKKKEKKERSKMIFISMCRPRMQRTRMESILGVIPFQCENKQLMEAYN